jgi:hypothetical protein
MSVVNPPALFCQIGRLSPVRVSGKVFLFQMENEELIPRLRFRKEWSSG